MDPDNPYVRPFREQLFMGMGVAVAGLAYVVLCLYGLPWEAWWFNFAEAWGDSLGDVGRVGGLFLFFGAFGISAGEISEAVIFSGFGGLAGLAFGVGMLHSSDELAVSGTTALICIAAIGMGGFAVGFSRRV